MRFRRRLSREAALAFSLVLVTASLPVAAQSAPAAATSDAGTRAIHAGEEGMALYEQGKWNEALARFREAEALYHSPVFGLYTARALRNAGRLLAAREEFRRLLDEKLEPSAPELWSQSQRDGATELAALEVNIPTVVLTVLGGSQATLLTLDDRAVAAGVSLELDPGSHRVVAKDGPRTAARDFALAAGSREQRITVTFSSPATHAAHPAANPPPDGAGPNVPGLVVTSVGGALLVAGGVVGVLALNAKSDTVENLPASCRGTKCQLSDRDEVEPGADKARHLGTAADVLFVSGAVVSAVGVGLLLFLPSKQEKPNVSVLVAPRGGALRVGF